MLLRRLISLMIVLLLFCSLLPGAASAERVLVDTRVLYKDGSVGEDGQEIVQQAIPGEQFVIHYQDAEMTQFWLQTLPGFVYQQLQIVSVYQGDLGEETYPYEDDLGNQWFQWLGFDLPQTLHLKINGVPFLSQSVTISPNAVPETSGDPDAPPEEPPQPTQSDDVQPAITMEPMPADARDYMRVLYDSTPLYGFPMGDQVGSLPANTILRMNINEAASAQHDAEGRLWLPVATLDGMYNGYLRLDAFRFMTEAEENQVFTPVGKQASDFAAINYDETTILDAYGNPVGTLYSTDVVIFNTDPALQVVDAQGVRWLQVTVDRDGGVSGYVRADQITFYTKPQEEAYIQAKNPPTTPPTDKPTDKPTAPQPTWDPRAQPRYAYVTGNIVNVRNDPNGSVIGQVKRDEVVLIRDIKKDSQNIEWYQVELVEQTNRQIGYAAAGYVRPMTDPEQDRYIREQQSRVTNPPTNPPTAAPVQQYSGLLIVNTQYAPLQVLPSIGAYPISVIPQSSVVYVYFREADAIGNIYDYIEYNGTYGYVLDAYLRQLTTQEYTNYTRKPTVQPTTAPTSSPNQFSGFGLLTGDKVNFRSTPSMSGNNRLTQLGIGTIVRVTGQTDSEGYTWYKCESNGTTGYLRGDFLSLLTIREYQLIASMPSYNSNGNIITPTATAKSQPGSNTWVTPRPNSTQTITFITLPPMQPTAAPTATVTVNPYATPSPDPYATPTNLPIITAQPTIGPTGAIGVGIGSVSPSPDPFATVPSPTFPTEDTKGFNPPGILVVLIVILVLLAGGFYGFSVYNKARRRQAQEQAARLAAEARRKAQQERGGMPQNGQPAVRRPVPPAQPGAQPPTPPQQRPSAPAQPSQNPYMRPTAAQKPPTQDVISTMPRAQVDGKPVAGNPASTNAAPAQQAPAQQTQPRPSAPANQFQRPASPQPPTRMPIAPPPTAPDDEESSPVRRRRRAQQNGDERDE